MPRASAEVEPVTIYHNPGCATSRKVLAAIEARGITPQVVRYLQAGWTRALLMRLLDALALKPADLLRPTEPETASLIARGDEEAMLAAMVRNPVLVQRPIVLTAKGAALCRPAERVAAIL